MIAGTASPSAETSEQPSVFARALETDRAYFELGASLVPLPGAVLAWMPGLAALPAAAVIHRVDPLGLAAGGEGWIGLAERRLAEAGVRLARIYLDSRGTAADDLLRRSGYADRDELVFAGSLPDPLPGLKLRPVRSDADWERKLRLHEALQACPDGHSSSASDWVAMERRKCANGMEAFLAELDGETVGAIGTVSGDGILRLKNVVVHPARRRRSIGLAILRRTAGLGKSRGIFQQCVYAISGEAGELLYRAAGMQVVGTQVEWSKPIGGLAR